MIFAVSLEALANSSFWIGVLVVAGTYALVSLGLQLNVGLTGIVNFGQAGFMAVGAYTAAILVTETGLSLWVALLLALLAGTAASVLVGLVAVRLRGDYFAIASIAVAEIVRLIAQNARGLTGGDQGLFGFDAQWQSVAARAADDLRDLGWSDADPLVPLLIAVWVCVAIAALVLLVALRTPWGRVLRAIREDEDVPRALGKNVLAYKLQSLAIAGALAALGGCVLALNLSSVAPASFVPVVTFTCYVIVIAGGLGSIAGTAIAALALWVVLEGLRFLELPISVERLVALRLIIVGALLIALMIWRPQGLLGDKRELTIGS